MARMDRYKKGTPQPALRPAYMPDDEQRFVSSFQEEEIYTEPFDEVENLYPDAFGEPVYDEFVEEEPHYSPHPVYQQRKHNNIWAIVIAACLGCLFLMGYFVVQLHKPYEEFCEKTAVVMQDTFAQGIIVDGVHIGGMTREQARQAVLMHAGYDQQELHIILEVEGYQWILTNQQLPVQRNIEAVLDMAYVIGRRGSPETIGMGITPMQCKYNDIQNTRNNIVYLNTQVTYDPATLRELVRMVAQTINRPARDAQVASFDFNTRSFTFTDEMTGLHLNEDLLYQTLLDTLERKNYRASIRMEAEKTFPNVTRVELMNSFSLISSYTTQTTSDQNRNNNVDLAARAVMGKVVMPGEEFSFNQTTGQRTTEKGYLPAAAIAGGTTVDEVGGGVCQVSSTLFNAAVMADMTIVKRSPHTWPSNYVDKGRDATVNWPNLDFVFRNDRSTPIFIVAYYKNRQCTVEIYGASLGPGEGRDMASVVIDVTEPPSEPIRNYNPELPWGTEKEVKKARTGYVVETYKIYTRNGQEYKRERICTSTYRVIQQVIDYNY
ncbi:MAG: VanW family protein [Clostridia bacterium]|nr:VanW family protein [Clostridia bacterium]